jgi:hypothetical protein
MNERSGQVLLGKPTLKASREISTLGQLRSLLAIGPRCKLSPSRTFEAYVFAGLFSTETAPILAVKALF